MGLTVRAKGLTETYDCGYVTFGIFRQKLAAAYDELLGAKYSK